MTVLAVSGIYDGAIQGKIQVGEETIAQIEQLIIDSKNERFARGEKTKAKGITVFAKVSVAESRRQNDGTVKLYGWESSRSMYIDKNGDLQGSGGAYQIFVAVAKENDGGNLVVTGLDENFEYAKSKWPSTKETLIEGKMPQDFQKT